LRAVLLTISLFECNVNTGIFNVWVEQDLLPKPPPGSVIVMDHATFHKNINLQILLKKEGYIFE